MHHGLPESHTAFVLKQCETRTKGRKKQLFPIAEENSPTERTSIFDLNYNETSMLEVYK